MSADGGESLDKLASGFRKRTLVTAKLATKVGFKMMRRTFGGKKERPLVDAAAAEQAARDLVREMNSLKGIVMKFGQMASYLPGALPDSAQRILASLQSEATAMNYDRVAEVIRGEFGCDVGELFETFDPKPLAAASIGQVHRARFEGQDVAVKVQYPGIEDLLRDDLGTISTLARMGTAPSQSDGKALAEELTARTLEECDYVQEARNQRFYRQLWSEDARRHVPDVIAARSTKRVLTTEFVNAARFSDFASTALQPEKDRAGETIFATVFNSIFRDCTYNADPHPGNYLFHPDGTVTFLDFGCVRNFDRHMIDNWKRVALVTLNNDFAGFKQVYPELGFVPNPKKFDWDYQWKMMEHLYRPLRGPFTFTSGYVKESYGVILFDNPNQYQLRLPAEWLYLNRLQWGLYAILAQLGATADWAGIFRSAVESETAPKWT